MVRKNAAYCAAYALAILLTTTGTGLAEELEGVDGGSAYWVDVNDGPEMMGGMVDTWLRFHVSKSISAAKAAGATQIIFAITTYGGQVKAADKIVNEIMMAAPLETIAYVDDRAISAGALIALACDSIYMKKMSMMGDAMAITVDASGGVSATGEKTTTFMRGVFRLTAEKRVAKRGGYPESFIALVEAMTDPSVVVIKTEVDGETVFVRESELNEFSRLREAEGKQVEVFDPVIRKGKILTMTSSEAIEKYGLIDGVVDDKADLLAQLGMTDKVFEAPAVSWNENLARFLSGGVVGFFLIIIALIGLTVGMMMPGKGIGGFVFLFAIGAFFWAHFFAGQAGFFEIAFFVLGIVLLAVEVFVIPGFGVFGMSGIALIFVSLALSFIPSVESAPGLPPIPFPWSDLGQSLFVVLMSGIGAAVGISLLARFLPRIPLFKHMILEPAGGAAAVGVVGAGMALKSELELVGKLATTHTPLRPAGKIEFGDKLLDAVTEAEFIEKGVKVKVVEQSGNRVVVEQVSGGDE